MPQPFSVDFCYSESFVLYAIILIERNDIHFSLKQVKFN